MPMFDLKCPECGLVEEYFLHKPEDKEFCSLCEVQLKIVFATCKTTLLNRQKPGSFKFEPKEMDAHKDMIHSFKLQEEQGGPKNEAEKEDTDYWYAVLKDKL